MHKWSFFAMGVMAGIIAVLSFALLAQSQGNYAWADQDDDVRGGGRGAGDGSLGVYAIPGMSQQGVEDCLWVMHKGKTVIPSKDPETEGLRATGQKLTLALYKITKNGEAIKLMSVRDISYDLALADLEGDKPSVQEIFGQLKKENERQKKAK